MLDPSQLRQFESEGFVVVRALLDPKGEVAALDAAYQDLIETLAGFFRAGRGCRHRRDSAKRPLGERFALMQGASGGHAVEHLDPVVSAFDPAYRRRSDLPSAQIPELFQLMRPERCSTRWSRLLGPEIEAVSDLSPELQARAVGSWRSARETASGLGRPIRPSAPTTASTWARPSGTATTPTRCPDSYASRVAVAWIPITEAGADAEPCR